MRIDKKKYLDIVKQLNQKEVTLVAVSKTKPIEAIQELYDLGQRDFGENYVQELVEKHEKLPLDIRWHFIGHLQTNKVKYIAPFVHLIHGVDSFKLLKEINKQGEKLGNKIHILLQVHIAQEETKFGLDEKELEEILENESELKSLQHVSFKGLMGMASFTENEDVIKKEFQVLKMLYKKYKEKNNFETLSMGMSADYNVAIEEGSNMVRIGSLIFGAR